MSDAGRQSLSDKVGAALKPDSQKTTTEHMGDKFHGKLDNAAGSMQPQGEKSYTQKVGDTFSGGHGATTNNNSSIVDKAKSALGMGHTHAHNDTTRR
ncbi:hypothetical protein EXIGLDRAFT_632404 [Exidia glandulosa HHB12029]|uniref:Chaperone/heat shock protein Hsp12 n=1 Tax=Exidia glandulosa HHB12029 TaxID=1314781 RepID=A0A166NIT8_EXIGL|nr:hypothetical protein EXIGLDRAFT_632404 [Exidia glandulosa HHB12029]